jgi:hypothetical protein
MPKAKPTQVIVHRLELQQTERDTLEVALAGRFLTNAVSAVGSVFTGVGHMLAPFGGVLTTIAGLWVAEKGATALIEAAEDTVEEGSKIADFLNPSKQQDAYQYVCAFLDACSGWDGDENSFEKKGGKVVLDLKEMNANPILLAKYQGWSKTVKFNFLKEGSWPTMPPSHSWKSYYSPSQYLTDLKAQLKENIPGL